MQQAARGLDRGPAARLPRVVRARGLRGRGGVLRPRRVGAHRRPTRVPADDSQRRRERDRPRLHDGPLQPRRVRRADIQARARHARGQAGLGARADTRQPGGHHLREAARGARRLRVEENRHQDQARHGGQRPQVQDKRRAHLRIPQERGRRVRGRRGAGGVGARGLRAEAGAHVHERDSARVRSARPQDAQGQPVRPGDGAADAAREGTRAGTSGEASSARAGCRR